MSNFAKTAAETGDQYLAAMADGQESFLKYVSAFSSLAPKPPFALEAIDTSGMRELSEAGFAFMEKLLEQQKSFSDRLLAASTPIKATPAPSEPSKAEPAEADAPEASQGA